MLIMVLIFSHLVKVRGSGGLSPLLQFELPLIESIKCYFMPK